MTRHRNLSSRFGEEKVTKSRGKVTKSVTKSNKKVTKSRKKVTKSKTITLDLDTLTPTMTLDLDVIQEVQELCGIKAKDCYRFYTDIRRRKNHSRTYFLDRMQEKLNDKMRKDDELKRMRR